MIFITAPYQLWYMPFIVSFCTFDSPFIASDPLSHCGTEMYITVSFNFHNHLPEISIHIQSPLISL